MELLLCNSWISWIPYKIFFNPLSKYFFPLLWYLDSHFKRFIFPIFDLLDFHFEYFLSCFYSFFILFCELLFLNFRTSSSQFLIFLNSSLKSSLINFRNIFIQLSEFLLSHIWRFIFPVLIFRNPILNTFWPSFVSSLSYFGNFFF